MQFARSQICLCLLAVLLAVTAFSIRFKADISTFFITSNTAQHALLANEIQAGVLSKRYLVAIGAEKQRPSAALINALLIDFKKISGVNAVWNAQQQPAALETLASVYASQAAHLYSYRPETDLQRLFSAEGLMQRAKLLKQALLSPYSASIKKIAATDPLLLSLNGIMEKSPIVFKSTTSATNYQHLIIETTPSGMDVVVQTYIQQQMLAIFAAQKHRFAEAVELEITGVPVFASVTQNRMQQEMQKISVISALVLGGLFFWLFKSLRLLFWVMALLVSVVCSALLVTQFVFGFVHALTLAIGTTLIGICVDYPIHALVHGKNSAKNQQTSAIAKIFPSMLLGGATTLIGYFALGLSGYPGFEQVAVYAGVGIAVALLLTRWVLPPLIHTDLSIPVTIQPALGWLNIVQQYRGYLLTGIAAALVVSVLALPSLHWMQDLQQLTPEMDELKAKDAQIRSRLVSVEPGRFVLIRADNTEQALQRLEQIYPQLDKLKAQGDLKDYFGLYPWLLSQQQQRDNARQLQQVLNPVNSERWQQSLLAEGLSVAHLGKLNYPSQQTLSMEQVFATPLGQVLEQQFIRSDTHTLAIIWLAEHNALALQKTFVNHAFAHYISQRDMLNDMAMRYQTQAVTLLLLGLLLIVVLLTWRYKNLWHALETLAPAALAAIFVLAGCALAGVAISFLHLVGLLLMVSIGVDYGIFYRENRSHNLPLTYQAMAASMLTSSLAFACLLLAETTVLKILAQVVATGVVLGFLLCPLLIQKTPTSA